MKRPSILFLTNSEHGQSNVILAVIYELLLRAEFDIHIASYSELEPRISQLRHSLKSDRCGSLTFYPLDGQPMLAMYEAKHGTINLPHPPGIKAAMQSMTSGPDVILPWGGLGYVQCYEQCKHLIQTIDPAVVVEDPLFAPGIDACRMSPQKLIILNPLGVKDLAGSFQPLYVNWCKFPAVSSGYSFPLPWYCIPANIIISIYAIFMFLCSAPVRSIMKSREKSGIHGLLPTMEMYTKDRYILSPALPEIDYPVENIPTNIISCGPIVLRTPSLSESDPDLAAWLEQRPTILINLGSHVVSHNADAHQLASGLRVLLDQREDLQVLWKLKLQGPLDATIAQTLAKEISSDRVRITSWLKADPVAILKTGQIVCSVHHGGANSWFEAVKFGVPHVVLPVWYDTYGNAICAEYLGIGIYGNRSVAPHIDAEEISRALSIVVGNGSPRSKTIRERAEILGKLCQKTEGRQVACEKISQLARS